MFFPPRYRYNMRPLFGDLETKKFMGHKQSNSVLAAIYDQAS